MLRGIVALLAVLAFAGCSENAPVDAGAALPGTWNCDDEIVFVVDAKGTYEWRVPANDRVKMPPGDNEHVRSNADGSYVLLGKWRLTGTSLELDMLGDTDRYSISFGSPSELKMQAEDSDTTLCTKS